LFSFIGIPPLIGFFAKPMGLSAALDQGYIFMALLAILTSVINAVYYLAVIKQIFFDKPNYKINPCLKIWICLNYKFKNNIIFRRPFNDIVLSNYLTLTVSLLTLLRYICLFSFSFFLLDVFHLY
jgi:NADH-ubiquinone oxidoreductase chain 2